MGLDRLTIKHVRNIARAELRPAARLNIIYGRNGAGKTSLLEAIDLLSRGRSFRSSKPAGLITQGQTSVLVAGRAAGQTLGIEKTRGNTRLRVNGRASSSVAALALALPVRILHPESHALIAGPPAIRRAFVDWGVFHQNTNYLREWRRYQRALSQRNALLRTDTADQASVWDGELSTSADLIDSYRAEYLRSLEPLAQRGVDTLLQSADLELGYRRGWPGERPLSEVLSEGLLQDRSRGFTGAGPHRAELAIRYGGHFAAERVSRGQQKLLAAALVLAQTELYGNSTGKRCVVMVDDLASELDEDHRQTLMAALQALNTQVFASVLDPDQLDPSGWEERKMFHVKHGEIAEML